MRLLDEVRAACAWVAGQAGHARIAEDRVAGYARMLLDTHAVFTAMDEPHHFHSEDPERQAAYVLALDSVNFGSGYFEETGLEYVPVAGGLTAAFARGEMDTAEKWARADAGDMHRIFCGPHPADAAREEKRRELMALFARHLNATGRTMLEEYGGRALGLIGAARGSAERLAEIMAGWPMFGDVAEYQGRRVPLLKRAQIFPAHLLLAMKGRGGADFHDMHRLTIFADNMVPHVLRCDGILVYDDALAAKIDAGVPLEPGGEEEVELRALAIHAVERMTAAAGGGVTAVNFDHILWNRGYDTPEIRARRPHRTRAVWY